MNNLAGEALVVRVAGGKGGGYTELTERGKKLLNNYQKIHTSTNSFSFAQSRR